MASPTTKKRTGFLDLPLELRQVIYEELRPSDSWMYNIGAPTVGDIDNISAAHPKIEQEYREWKNKHCKNAVFNIMTTSWPAPTCARQFNRLDQIMIVFCYFDEGEDAVKKASRKKRSDFDTLRENAQKLVQWLNSRYTTLPYVAVSLQQSTPPLEEGQVIPNREDPFWTRKLTVDENTTGNFLDTLDGTYDTPTIFEYVLEPLIELNKCRKFHVKDLNSLHSPGHDYWWPGRDVQPMGRKLDWDYMMSFVRTIEVRLHIPGGKGENFHQSWNESLSETRKDGARILAENLNEIKELNFLDYWEARYEGTWWRGWRYVLHR